MIRTAIIAALALTATAATAEEGIKRTYTGSFPIAQSVTVPPGYKTIYVSGMVPAIINPDAPTESFEAYGDTAAQTESVLKRIETALKAEGAGFGDVVNMKVYLVGDPKLGGKMDFAGMMKTYTKYFGTTEQPNKPSRVTAQVAALASPYFLVEIEVTAAIPAK
ncbi:RidA family protein [Asticcacaulis sp. YBE204]|uniref:RidA family protein n=1 Tax=Asticcacaulis sp. YBE204 TaxID=1282363 RepID=UPI0003C3DB75|nr:RidA family protein [Asticcacaulis sp. YBE204]ESQ79783.1 hypothetical protein AEYBE204_08030 [Asticcacaulis sp. YBE204]